ncbi:22740_t:CDS:10 [Gigaspora margarita]|uniref:22740_t:CDS:1 n=1 Tax=Gigaspora margarita TaxID=4874 RepID=A0ABN7URS4_GIGMA|nr:22740_t:CDS:10 [Gigaspora margarita]
MQKFIPFYKSKNSNTSLDTFKSQLMSNSEYECRVKVNQRCLIDKMLSRYSTKFAVFRELLQNSDDATSSSVEIVFDSTKGETYSRLLFKNNGMNFREQDWDRLKKIAEGNPDEQKGFTTNLRQISVYFNENELLNISKEIIGHPRSIKINSNINRESPEKLFKFESVNIHNVKFEVITTPRTVSYRNQEKKRVSVCFQIASGNLKVQIQRKFSSEMERLTKKKPPSKTTIQAILPIYSRSSDMTFDIFKDLLPYPEQGNIFIGFRTHQTTSYSVNFAARVIPTVERESIDFAEKTLSVYNTEMLCSIGALCRVLYEDEMNKISQLYQHKSDENQLVLEECSVRILNHFTFEQSTPDVKVGNIIESQFYRCCSSQLSILSTHGVKPINLIRLPNPEMTAFIKTTPVVPKIMMDHCESFFSRANSILKLIEQISINDVFKELKNRILDVDEMIALMKWWITRNFSITDHNNFMQLATVNIENKVLHLKNICHFQNPGIINPGLDVPSNVLPYAISQHFNNKLDIFKQNFRNWTELSLITWTRYIVGKYNFKNNSAFAEEFISTLSRGFKNAKKEDQFAICQLLSKIECIPTQFGVKRPSKTYFSDVTLFSDLPNISIKGDEKFFTEIGINKYVELDVVFARLVNSENLDHMKLLKYFAKFSEDLKDSDIEKLKKANIWIKECTDSNKSVNNVQRYLARDLYTPCYHNKELELPIINWKGHWNKNSNEAKFIIGLGLQEYPSIQTIFQLAEQSQPLELREKALQYFIKNFKEKYFKIYNANLVHIKFLPCINDIYAKPSECYSNPHCTKMGFDVLRQDLCFLAKEIGVKKYPDYNLLQDKFVKNLPNMDNVKEIFEFMYFATHESNSNLKVLQNIKFIPIQEKVSPYKIIYHKPDECFFKVFSENYVDIFKCVDFGETANKFLKDCGVKQEPSTLDLAEYLIKSSREFWSKLNNKDSYTNILGTIAHNYEYLNKIKPGILDTMKRCPILLGIKKEVDISGTTADVYELACAEDIFINDNDKYRNIFNSLICPFTDRIEKFYEVLGSQSLDANVSTTTQHIAKEMTSIISHKVNEKILERVPWYYSGIKGGDLKNDISWIETLQVKQTDQINMNYVLIPKHEIKTNQISACVSENGNRLILYITNENYTDIANALVQRIHRRPERQHCTNLYLYLTSSIEQLHQLGYPTENISVNIKNVKIDELPNPPEPIKQLSTDEFENMLLEGITSCKSNYNRSIPTNNNPVETFMTEEKYYDSPLIYVKTINYIELHIKDTLDPSIILFPTATMEGNIQKFINVLVNVAEIFELPRNKINIFYDDDSTMVAFNRNKTLFFNLKCDIDHGRPFNKNIVYWFFTFCHELAHNFISPHNADFVYYLQSYANKYFSKLTDKIGHQIAYNQLVS